MHIELAIAFSPSSRVLTASCARKIICSATFFSASCAEFQVSFFFPVGNLSLLLAFLLDVIGCCSQILVFSGHVRAVRIFPLGKRAADSPRDSVVSITRLSYSSREL